MRVMLPWTSACSTVATCSSGTLLTVPTGSWRSSSTDVATSGSTCTTRSIGCPGSRVTWVTVWATSALRTSFATWAAVSPTAMALVGSTVIWISAVAWTRSLWRLASDRVVLERGEDGCGRGRHLLRVLRADDDRSARWR